MYSFAYEHYCCHSEGEFVLVVLMCQVVAQVVNALSSLKPIVTPKWLEDYVVAIRNGTAIPDHAE